MGWVGFDRKGLRKFLTKQDGRLIVLFMLQHFKSMLNVHKWNVLN